MIAVLENMDAMIGSSHYEREDSEIGNSVRRPESHSYDTLLDSNSNSHPNLRENEIRNELNRSHGK